MTWRPAGLLISIVVLIAVGAGCGSSGGEEVEAAARRTERAVIGLAQEASALVSVSRVSYSCDASDAPGGSVVADADGTASAEQVLEAFSSAARSGGWVPTGDEDPLVLSKVIDGREFFVVAPGSGSELEAGSDRLLVAWHMDRSAC
jgi:hypothetical protein